MIVIAHRGSNQKSCENSINAIKTSFYEGASRIELDVQLSKDSILYINHENYTSRNFNCYKLITKSNSKDLDLVIMDNAERLVKLEDVFKLFCNELKEIELNLDMKVNNLKAFIILFDLIKKYPKHLEKRIIISSSDKTGIKKLTDYNKNHNFDCLTAYIWPNLNNLRSYENYFNYFGSNHQFDIIFDHIYSVIKKNSINIIHPWAVFWPEKLQEKSKKHNLKVYTWSSLYDQELINDCELWSYLKYIKVDGHCTNYPLELKNFLNYSKKST